MKPKLLSSIFVAALAAACIAYLCPNNTAAAAPKETAYERIMRTGTIRCGYVGWFPYYRKDLKTGEQSGINYEIMSAIGKELGLKIEWAEEVGWGNMGEGLKTGRYDMVCTSLWPDGPKIMNFTLSRPMFYSQLYPFVRNNDNRFDGNMGRINQPDVKIAGIDGAFSYNIAKDNFPKAQIVALPEMVSEAEFFLNVADGKADVLAAVDKDEIKEFMQKNPGKLRQVKDVPPVHIFPHVMMLAPDEKQLAEKINFAIGLLVDNGVIARIVRNYSDNYLLPTPGYAK